MIILEQLNAWPHLTGNRWQYHDWVWNGRPWELPSYRSKDGPVHHFAKLIKPRIGKSIFFADDYIVFLLVLPSLPIRGVSMYLVSKFCWLHKLWSPGRRCIIPSVQVMENWNEWPLTAGILNPCALDAEMVYYIGLDETPGSIAKARYAMSWELRTSWKCSIWSEKYDTGLNHVGTHVVMETVSGCWATASKVS